MIYEAIYKTKIIIFRHKRTLIKNENETKNGME